MNLEAFLHNGRIQILEKEITSEDTDSINTEIVNQIRNGENVTIYSESVGNVSNSATLETNQGGPEIIQKSEEEVVGNIFKENQGIRKKVLIVVSSTDTPMALPSWHEVAEKPKTDNPPEWEKWGRNTFRQKAWASKFPFLAEHYESIPVNERINAWHNRVENSESVFKYSETNKDIFDNDPEVGEDIRNLFKDRKDIFHDDPDIGENIKRMFEDEERK